MMPSLENILGFLDSARKTIPHKLGLTKRTMEEKSEIIYDDFQVSKYIERRNSIIRLYKCQRTVVIDTPRIAFRKGVVAFDMDNTDLFNRFHDSEEVRVGYREVYKVTTDYVAPDFDEKKEVGRTLVGYEFVSAERTSVAHSFVDSLIDVLGIDDLIAAKLAEGSK